MIKGLVNWIYTERLIETASYILEKKEKKKKLVREQELSTLYVKVSVQPEGL